MAEIGPIQPQSLIDRLLFQYGNLLARGGSGINQLATAANVGPRGPLYENALRLVGQDLTAGGNALRDWGMGFTPVRGSMTNPVVNRNQLIDAASGLFPVADVAGKIPGAVRHAAKDFAEAAVRGVSRIAPESKMPTISARMARAWELGQKHKEKMGELDRESFYERLPSDELRFIASIEDQDPLARAFYESALRGAAQPRYAKGWRYGDAPQNGVSRNHVDDRSELGISMANVEGIDYQWAPMGSVGNAKEYEGWLLDPDSFWGSDGEPLMVGIVKR